MKYLLIAFCFSSVYSFGQSKTNSALYRTVSWGGLCSKSFRLFDDMTFRSESGCENSSRISFGTWTRKKNVITIIPLNPEEYPIVKKADFSLIKSDSVFVKIFDSSGVNISKQVRATQVTAEGKRYTLTFDSTCNCRTDLRRGNKKLVLNYLEKLFGKKVEFETKDSNVAVITLNLSINSFWNFFSTWDSYEPFSLIQNGNELVSQKADQFTQDSKLIKTVYERIQ